MNELPPRQRLLQVQQDLIELLPDSIDVELQHQDQQYAELRVSRSLPGGPHPNHTHIRVHMDLVLNMFALDYKQGKKKTAVTGGKHQPTLVHTDEMLKLVKSSLHIFSIYDRSK